MSSGLDAGDVAGAAAGRARQRRDREGDAGLPLRSTGRHSHGPDRQGLHRRRDPGDRRLVRHTEVKSSRREFLKLGVTVSVGAALFPARASAQSTAARVVVVGGGFAGASCARALRQADPRIVVTLVEAAATFTACPFSTTVIACLRELPAQQFTYERAAADAISILRAVATSAYAQMPALTLAD